MSAGDAALREHAGNLSFDDDLLAVAFQDMFGALEPIATEAGDDCAPNFLSLIC
jgi:hypothetical protein